MKKITVLLAEDHTVVREGFRILLEMEADLEVIGEARDGRKAIAMAKELNPDVILMDIAMPKLNGLEATRQLLKARPSVRILILSAHSDDAYVDSATKSGAAGFLLKQTSAQDVCRAIRKVHKGEAVFTRTVAQRIKRLNPDPQRVLEENRGALTSREMEILQLIAEGKANKESAEELGISIKTVEKPGGT